MTREEAAKELKIELSMWESDCKSYHKTKEALDMAIKALQAEPCEDCVSRKAINELFNNEIKMYEERIETRKGSNYHVKNADFVNKIAEIADHYGFDSQSHMLIEEMAELTQAINKLYRVSGTHGYPTDKTLEEVANNLREEIADVEICLEEIKYLLNNHNFVNEWKKKKIKRQLERMRKEKDK